MHVSPQVEYHLKSQSYKHLCPLGAVACPRIFKSRLPLLGVRGEEAGLRRRGQFQIDFLLERVCQMTIPMIIQIAAIPAIINSNFDDVPVSGAEVSGTTGVASGVASGVPAGDTVSGWAVGISVGTGSGSAASGVSVASGIVA